MIKARKATLADAADIIRIGRDVFSATFGHSVPEPELLAYLDSAYTEPLISAELEDATKDILVAVHHHRQLQDVGSDPTSAASSSSNSNSSSSSSSSTPDDGVVVGFAQLTRGSSSAEPCVAKLAHAGSSVELQRLYVDLSYHGMGIGSRLAGAIEDIARNEGFTHMWLGVWEENRAAARVYAKLGYSGIGFHDFVVGSIVQRDDILMKQL
ncbi:Acyl-CoA N-acyltransferase [Beauveria brongniartii RCEF 3172]|uniref:Acyl-CoA N-acyltransferase n=1 Tax=Beauveria brongniartii RCEF 3172 TaxID=1081107 RepID=A0A167KW79_9HYPO|nr:Acyl-CoA N-acyltransferase [Beauveria brongniartii RCEF 3172]